MYYRALLNTLMGMGTVFAMLILISLVISMFVFVPRIRRRWNSFKLRRSIRKKRGKSVTIEAKRPVLPKEPEPVNEEEGILIAVITAAIMAASADQAVSADRLVVRSIRRVRR